MMNIASFLSSRMSCRLLCCFLFIATTLKLVSGQIYIDDPPHLVRYIQGSTAAFGTPFYGEHILGQLFYGQPRATEEPHCHNDYNPLPLVPADHSNSTYAAAPVPGPLTRIIVVRRGGCHFAQKVQIAEEEHDADAVIVVDNDPARDSADVRMIIMAEDDGRRREVDIPSVLISYEEGERLIGAILAGENVFARMEWDVPNAPTVEIDQWVSPALSSSVKFLEKFAAYARRFGEHIDFRPHYWIFSLVKDYKTMCTDSSGKFCSINAEWGNATTGKSVVQESVRQKCLWRESRSDSPSGFPSAYWNYVERLPSRCPASHNVDADSSHIFGEDCSLSLMAEIGAPLSAVKLCYQTEFDEILVEEKFTLAWSPTATMINNWRYAGPLVPSTVASAICTGFFEEPSVCEELEDKDLLATPIVTDSSVPVAWWIYLVTVLGVILAMLLVVVCYRGYLYRRLRNELRYEVFEEVKNRTQATRTVSGSQQERSPPPKFQEAEAVKAFDGVSIVN